MRGESAGEGQCRHACLLLITREQMLEAASRRRTPILRKSVRHKRCPERLEQAAAVA